MAELRRVCCPDGQVLVTVPAFSFLWGAQDEIAHHRRRYTRAELGVRLRAARLRPELLTYFNAFLFPIIAGVRVARRLVTRPSRELWSDFTMTKPGATNALLTRVLGAVAPLIRSIGFPFGVSILCLACPLAAPVSVELRSQPAAAGVRR